jgi:hypothetical protein
MPRYEFRAYISVTAANEDDARLKAEEALTFPEWNETFADVLATLDESAPDHLDEED